MTKPDPKPPLPQRLLRVAITPAVVMLEAVVLFVAARWWLSSAEYAYAAFGCWSLLCVFIGRWTVNPLMGTSGIPADFDEKRVFEMLTGKAYEEPPPTVIDTADEQNENPGQQTVPHVRGL